MFAEHASRVLANRPDLGDALDYTSEGDSLADPFVSRGTLYRHLNEDHWPLPRPEAA